MRGALISMVAFLVTGCASNPPTPPSMPAPPTPPAASTPGSSSSSSSSSASKSSSSSSASSTAAGTDSAAAANSTGQSGSNSGSNANANANASASSRAPTLVPMQVGPVLGRCPLQGSKVASRAIREARTRRRRAAVSPIPPHRRGVRHRAPALPPRLAPPGRPVQLQDRLADPPAPTPTKVPAAVQVPPLVPTPVALVPTPVALVPAPVALVLSRRRLQDRQVACRENRGAQIPQLALGSPAAVAVLRVLAGAGAGNPGGGSVGGPATNDEQRAAINHRIDESMVAFDHHIQHAQDELNKERDAVTATGAGGAGGAEGGGQEGGGGAGGEKGGHPSGGAQGGTGATGSAAGTGTAATGHGGASGAPRTGASGGGTAGSSNGGSAGGISNGPARVPADVGNGSDDDIVARQLREAAMKEKDPQLQEKLWQEYRDYKQAAK